MTGRHLLFFVADDRFFVSHFLNRARVARDSGYRVSVLACESTWGPTIAAEGMRLIPLPIARSGTNPLRELLTVARVVSIYRRERPDVMHHVALKPIIYGSIAARVLRMSAGVINAPVGMGFVFTADTFKARVLRPIVRTLLRLFLHPPGSTVVFENPDDMRSSSVQGAVRLDGCALIRGAGVDVQAFRPTARDGHGSAVVVTLAARMLWDKGVREFVEAARMLKARGVAARFQLAGGTDALNPSCIAEQQLRAWQEEGAVAWLGHQADMAAVWAASDIACLPSYREGLPKALLEAAAAGLPIVATDVPGCREAVDPDRNGLLVPARDPSALAQALERLIADAGLRARYGTESRRMAEEEFSDAIVTTATLRLYDAALRQRRSRTAVR